MAFGQLDRDNQPQPLHEINITPLVDVMLVLLVIFIVTAPLLTHTIKLNLPKATAQVAQNDQPRVVISLTREGLYWDSERISHSDLESRLRATAVSSQPSIVLRADKQVIYQEVIKVIDAVQKAGIAKLSFSTDPKIT